MAALAAGGARPSELSYRDYEIERSLCTSASPTAPHRHRRRPHAGIARRHVHRAGVSAAGAPGDRTGRKKACQRCVARNSAGRHGRVGGGRCRAERVHRRVRDRRRRRLGAALPQDGRREVPTALRRHRRRLHAGIEPSAPCRHRRRLYFGIADGTTPASPTAPCRHRRRLYFGIADGSMPASPTALFRHRRRLYVGVADGSMLASPTACLARRYRHAGARDHRLGFPAVRNMNGEEHR